MEWTEEQIETLRRLWAEGLSTAEIGRRMGISKNAVVGKAHRLHLPARPSPIRRGGEGAKPAAPRPPRRTLRPAMPRPSPLFPAAEPRPAPAPVPAEPRRAPAPVVPMPRVEPLRTGNATCCWPIGDPGTPGFRFCGAPALIGKPYCAEHAAIAYVRVKDRREDAA
ncbi:GcrA family cell cycle regulator [Elioraea thermophila]|uniref:GcrA family cell cycle regulator n=1 Tax=Elioraea thermophila TaxID=2185104 RepID=UPI000DF1C37C|nr:GcrA family cell cycle regulator [Elioraea thermophila]